MRIVKAAYKWVVTHEAYYGAPVNVLYHSDDKKACENWQSAHGSAFRGRVVVQDGKGFPHDRDADDIAK